MVGLPYLSLSAQRITCPSCYMGPSLADGVAEGSADGSEWRTPPLWGLGLLNAVSGEVRLLHDGRAFSMEEAILWHDGEAADSL